MKILILSLTCLIWGINAYGSIVDHNIYTKRTRGSIADIVPPDPDDIAQVGKVMSSKRLKGAIWKQVWWSSSGYEQSRPDVKVVFIWGSDRYTMHYTSPGASTRVVRMPA